MKFLIDENVPAILVNWLRGRGHDVYWVAESQSGAADERLLKQADSEGRLIVTADKDFGELVYRDHLNSQRIILLRLGTLSLKDRLERLKKAWSVVEANSHGAMIVISAKKVRVRPMRTKPEDQQEKGDL